MALKMNVSYAEKDGAEELLRETRRDVIITAYMVNIDEKVKCMIHQSSYQYGGIRSTINHVYILARVKIPERMKRELSTFIAGMERTVTVEKQMLGLDISEGKNPISLEAYEILANTLFESG